MSIAPRFFHVSYFRLVLRRCIIFFYSSYRTSSGVSLSLCVRGGERSVLGYNNDQLVFRNCSIWLRNSLGLSCVYCCKTLRMCWTTSTRAHPQHLLPLLTQQIRVGKIRTQASLDEEYVRNVLSKWKKATRQTSWLGFLWPVPPTLRPNWASSTAGRICTHPWHFRDLTGFSRDPAFRKRSTLPLWDSWMACPWFWRQAPDQRWAGEAARQNFAGSLSCSGQRVPFLRRLDSGFFRKHWSSTSCASQSFVRRRSAPTEWELKIGRPSLGTICLDGQLGKCQLACSRNEVLVSSVFSAEHLGGLFVVAFLIIDLFQSIILNGMFPPILVPVTERMKAHKQFDLKFEERASHTWLFLKTWRKDDFYRVAVGVTDHFYGDASSKLVIFGIVLCAIGSGASLVTISLGSNTLVECYKEHLGSRYMQGLLDYPTFDVRLLKRCLEKNASTVFGTLDPFSMTEFIVTRFRGSEHHDRMQSRQPLRRAIETGETWAGRRFQQHHRCVAARCLWPKRDWEEGQWR